MNISATWHGEAHRYGGDMVVSRSFPPLRVPRIVVKDEAMPVTDLPMPATGRFIASVHYFPLRVYFEDTDLSGLVYHANYLRYMERARSDMLRAAGIDQRAQVEGGGGVYAIADLTIAYKRPARLDDELIVRSYVTAVGAATCSIHQSVMRGDDMLTDGKVTAAWLTPGGRPQRQPRPWITIFTSLAQGEDFHP